MDSLFHNVDEFLKRRGLRPWAAVAAIAAVAAAVGALLWAEPRGLLVPCPFRLATSLSCPGCGSQRFFLALLHGHPAEAFRANMLLPLVLVYLGLMVLLPHTSALRRALTSAVGLYVLLALIVLWAVVRNIYGV